MLSWRPDIEKKSFVRADSQLWCKDLPEGSHRYPKSWLADRYSWLNEDGVPCEADWKSCGKRVKTHKDMEDATAHGEEGAVVKMSCWADVPELKDGIVEHSVVVEADEEELGARLSYELCQASKLRRLSKVMDDLAGIASGSTIKKKASYRQKRLLRRQMDRRVLKAWRKEQGEMLKKYSRGQLLEAIIPAGGGKVKRTPVQLKGIEGESKKKAKVTKAMRIIGHVASPMCSCEMDFHGFRAGRGD